MRYVLLGTLLAAISALVGCVAPEAGPGDEGAPPGDLVPAALPQPPSSPAEAPRGEHGEPEPAKGGRGCEGISVSLGEGNCEDGSPA